MLKGLLTSKTAWYSDRCKMIWKERDSKSNVLLFQLVASVRGINEGESGLLDATQPTRKMTPTPTAQDYIERKCTSTEKENPLTGKSVTLNRFVKHWPRWPQPEMYPTPTAGNCMDVFQPPEYVEQNTTGWTVTRKGTGTKFGAKLNDVVHKIQNEKMYPTPLARDWKMMSYNPITNKIPMQKSIPTEVLKDNRPGGKLNPNFVEFLMGYPMNYTQIEPTESKHSETQSCHKSQNKSLGVS